MSVHWCQLKNYTVRHVFFTHKKHVSNGVMIVQLNVFRQTWGFHLLFICLRINDKYKKYTEWQQRKRQSRPTGSQTFSADWKVCVYWFGARDITNRLRSIFFGTALNGSSLSMFVFSVQKKNSTSIWDSNYAVQRGMLKSHPFYC